MKAQEANLLTFLQTARQFRIPIYQRTYSWRERECRQLWDDIVRTGGDEAITAHFLGSIVYIQEDIYHVTANAPLLVIDGQQRLATVTLVLEALARRLGDSEPVDGFSAPKIRAYYLQNSLEIGDRRHKLLLTQTDRDTLIALLGQRSRPVEHSIRLSESFDLFDRYLHDSECDVVAVCRGLAKLVVVDISLSRGHDNPQLIFESMNSTGRELTQADLIRNFVLMGLPPDHQTELYVDHWRPIEQAFGQAAYSTHFDPFMRHYLTLKTGEIPNIRAVYEAFKNHWRESWVQQDGVDALVADIHAYAEHYCAMALGHEPDSDLDDAFRDLRDLNVDVAYPLLLELYQDYRTGLLSRDDLLTAVRLIEAYVFRRAVGNIPTNSLNKTFATFGRELRKERYLESIKAHFVTLPSYRRFPDDEEFARAIQTRDLYNFGRRTYWLRRMENHDRKERVPVHEYTIEHIMPQNENLSADWRAGLGPDWRRVQEQWLHTLGNLTLTGYNAEYSDRPFREKRDMEGGFAHSPLRLNEHLGETDTWNEAALQERAARLARLAVQVWGVPSLPYHVLQQYRERAGARPSYSIQDHAHLAHLGPIRTLFDALQAELLALDPNVTEEFLKYYVAFKAETNFVDVVPQASRLRLSLNLPFADIDDPKGLCRDITNVGRWGNGDVEVGFDNLGQLPYVMYLVTQALERQLGNDSEK
jgi:uncharacterized protein with ParB-like and HNH nuclease domain/predicted transport protein